MVPRDQQFEFVHINHLWASPLLDEDGNASVFELDVLKEVEKIEVMLEKCSENCGAAITFRSAVATSYEFIHRSTSCDIAHYSMHGHNNNLKLEFSYEPFTDDMGKMDPFTTDDIIDLNSKYAPFVVFASACQSEEVGNTFHNIGIPHVIAIDR